MDGNSDITFAANGFMSSALVRPRGVSNFLIHLFQEAMGSFAETTHLRGRSLIKHVGRMPLMQSVRLCMQVLGLGDALWKMG